MADQLIYVQNDETLNLDHEILSQNKIWHLTNSSEQTDQVYPLTGSLQSVFIESASHTSQLLHSSGHTISLVQQKHIMKIKNQLNMLLV